MGKSNNPPSDYTDVGSVVPVFEPLDVLAMRVY